MQRLALFHIACLHHRGCLCSRPAYNRIPKWRTTLTKITHLLQSAKNSEYFGKCVEKVVRTVFGRVPVIALPPGGRDATMAFLNCTRAARDLSDAEVNDLLDFFNEPLDGNLVVLNHLCLPGCRFQCREKPNPDKHSLNLAVKFVDMVVVRGGLVVPLEYRFKHMEACNAKVMRGRGMGRVMGQAFELLTPKMRQEAVCAANGLLSGETLSYAAKNIIKALVVLNYLETDPDLLEPFKAHTVSHPIQKSLPLLLLLKPL